MLQILLQYKQSILKLSRQKSCAMRIGSILIKQQLFKDDSHVKYMHLHLGNYWLSTTVSILFIH